MENKVRGEIITFYSYKGGTGRTMSLANVACILAEQPEMKGKGVLMIDWDLEAPGLHRFFQDRLAKKISPTEFRSMPGLIDLFYEFNKRTDIYLSRSKQISREKISGTSEELAHKVIGDVDLNRYLIPTAIKNLTLLKAGRFYGKNIDKYPEKVNKFNWEGLYNKSPQLMRVFAETLAKEYDYVLVDSRTGISDISNVCTALLPEKLVIVFTPNQQSLNGALEVVRRATEYRRESFDLRPLTVFPLVSRIDVAQPDLRHDWRYGDKQLQIAGYQNEFKNLFSEIYEDENIDLQDYFNEVQIQHIPRYAYGEQIAVLIEKNEDVFSLKRRYRKFAERLLDAEIPWEFTKPPPPLSFLEKIISLVRRADRWLFASSDNQIVRFYVLFALFSLSVAFMGLGSSIYLYQRSTQAEGNLATSITNLSSTQEDLRLSKEQLETARQDITQKEKTIADLLNPENTTLKTKDEIIGELAKSFVKIKAENDGLRKAKEDLTLDLRICRTKIPPSTPTSPVPPGFDSNSGP
jgi:cellulose biosynthesis protein BcsQ